MRPFLACLAVAGLFTFAATASALPPLPRYMKETLGTKEEYKPFMAQVDGLKARCDLCHKPGEDKKQKGHALNEFGEAFHKRLDHKTLIAADKAKEYDKGRQVFNAAWEKVLENKNATGKTYGALI